MKVTIESKTPVYTQGESPEYLRLDVRASVQTEAWSSSSTFALDLPEQASDQEIEAAIVKLYG